MKRNFILVSAIALALGTAGAHAAQDAEECAQDALQLKMQIEQSNLADPDRAKLESSLSEAQSTDLARCEQIVARVKREVGASADATTQDDYGAAASRETSNAAGAAAGTTAASPSSPTGMPSGADKAPASGAQSAPVNPGAATTTMHTLEEAANKPNPSTSKIAAMTSDELVDKPVEDANGDQVGEIGAIVVDRNATPHAYAVVEYGGLLGIGEKHVLVDLDKLELTADGSVRVPVTDEDAFSAYPRYEEKLYQKYEGDLGRLLQTGG